MESILVLRVTGAAGLARNAHGASNLNLEIVLDGIVPEAVVSACNAALTGLASNVLSLAQTLPILRFQDGFWTFVCSCAAKFRLTVVTEGFLMPIFALGYYLDVGIASTGAVVKGGIGRALATFQACGAAGEVTFIHGDRGTIGPVFRPAPPVPEGGGGALLAFDWTRSIEAAPRTRFDVTQMAGNGLVVGVGWDAMRNRTYEKLYGGSGPPDLDVACYTCNRWGEVLDRLSSKGTKSLSTPARVAARLRAEHRATYQSAIQVSADCQSGAQLDDDELLALNLSNLDPSVSSILVCVSIASGATDFNYVRNLYCRVLDVVGDSMEVELCRFRAPLECPQDSKTCVMLRFERSLADAAAPCGCRGSTQSCSTSLKHVVDGRPWV